MILSGDLATYENERDKNNVMEAEYDVDKVLKILETGHDRPVYWIPGNHDPISTYEKQKKFGTRSINLHAVRILFVVVSLFSILIFDLK